MLPLISIYCIHIPLLYTTIYYCYYILLLYTITIYYYYILLYTTSTNIIQILGNNDQKPYAKHQEKLNFRISQNIINTLVESNMLCCTHFDAWRFFHPQAQENNPINPLTRQDQHLYEQPACIHATMDLFKYAYQIYPLISASLLIDCLQVAVEARKIDMRASPYDVSHIEGCEIPIAIETENGRALYVKTQEQLMRKAMCIRDDLIFEYNKVINLCLI